MKVLHVIHSIASVRGGPSHAAIEMVKSLRRYGVEAEIATTNDNGVDLLDVPLEELTEFEEVPVRFFPRFVSSIEPIREYGFSSQLTSWLRKHMNRYDIIHTHYLFTYASTCAGAIARTQKLPYVVSTIGQLSSWALNQSRLKKQAYFALIEQKNLKYASAIHCTTDGEAADVRRFGLNTPTFELPLGVEEQGNYPEAKLKLCKTYDISIHKPIILFLARLHHVKRPDLLMEAVSQIITNKYDVHLIVAGSGEPDYENYLKKLVVSLDLVNHVSFAGFVAGENKQLLLHGSDIFVLPSFTENFGVAVVEAMAAGLPVVITPDIQIAPEINKEKAGLVSEGEVNNLTKSILELLTNPDYRYELGQNARNLVNQKYSWNVITHKLVSAYQSVINKHNF